jgi:hypothetical protein
MTDQDASLPAGAEAAFEAHDAFDPVEDDGENPVEGEGESENRSGDDRDDPARYAVDTTRFEGTVTARATEGDADRYEVRVRIPAIDAATADDVGPSVAAGWFETMERRLADAPKSTRASVHLEAFRLAEADGADGTGGTGRSGDAGETEGTTDAEREPAAELVVTYDFEYGDADRAAAIAKTFVEYVEGTYVESTIPGYRYEGVVGDLLSSAASTGGSEEPSGRGSTPL